MNYIKLTDLTNYLDNLLNSQAFKDDSVNGLQFYGKETIKKIAVATDASIDTFRAACENNCDLLLVHHGIFWTYAKESAIDKLKKAKLKWLFDYDLSLYAAHLPLDMHKEVGNNTVFANLINLSDQEPLINEKGEIYGVVGNYNKLAFLDLVAQVKEKVGPIINAYDFNSKPVQRVAIVTGGGHRAIPLCQKYNFDTFITGEMPHYSYHVAKELSVNVILAGHYQSETLGVKALGEKIKQEFNIPFTFLDFPTGL